MKSETGKALRKEDQNRWQEASLAISTRAILLPFAGKFLALKCFGSYGGLWR
jgi:hypothetical protein